VGADFAAGQITNVWHVTCDIVPGRKGRYMPVVAERSSRKAAALTHFRRVRQASTAMCAPLTPEEYRLQPMEDVSPPWWNLGHTSWFFVRNVVRPFGGQIEPEDEQYDYLLNSYYQALGERLPRSRRGSISRPTTDEIYAYRASVDERVVELVEGVDDQRLDELLGVLTIGIQHEQQHQELFYTEIKYIRHQNIAELREPYLPSREAAQVEVLRPLTFTEFHGGLLEFGNCEGGWCWDNELPVHKQYLEPFALADRLLTNGEYLAFIDDGGYANPLLWLDNGWQQVQAGAWRAPLYWERIDGQWWAWTLHGMQPLELAEPVCHVSFYEADAFSNWKAKTTGDDNLRLPTEREWEHAARGAGTDDNAAAFLDSGRLHPSAGATSGSLRQLAGCLWQWTSSYYEPYPGYRPFPDVLAEYNGKFMDNQRVLRGGSCVTPRDHYRTSYRNFWPAPTRFQFTGIRLARGIKEERW
jgi:ergothioneine biosynthesis protein EgtB